VSRLKTSLIRKSKRKYYLTVLPSEEFEPYKYVENLVEQMKADIFPLLASKRGAFTVPRNCFCFIDHISSLQLLDKYPKDQTKRIEEILGSFMPYDTYINSKYQRYSAYIVQVYRHDLVHNIRPFPHSIKVIELGTKKEVQRVAWFILSDLVKSDAPRSFDSLSDYFRQARNRKGYGHLRYHGNQVHINNFCLFFDLVNYLVDLAELLKTDFNLQKTVAENYQSISEKHFEIGGGFVLNKNADKEILFRKQRKG
jgi:hypothetical protein